MLNLIYHKYVIILHIVTNLKIKAFNYYISSVIILHQKIKRLQHINILI